MKKLLGVLAVAGLVVGGCQKHQSANVKVPDGLFAVRDAKIVDSVHPQLQLLSTTGDSYFCELSQVSTTVDSTLKGTYARVAGLDQRMNGWYGATHIELVLSSEASKTKWDDAIGEFFLAHDVVPHVE